MATIIFTNGENPDFIFLCKQLDNNLNVINGKEKQKNYNHFTDIHDIWIAYEENTPVGCAAFKHYEENVAEVKRVFVKPENRGKGISKKLMNALEQKAREKGYHTLILETGKHLKEAINLYSKREYVIIENYGQYKDMEESLCMKKVLSK